MCDNVKIKKDLKGNLVVQIDEIIFKNKQNIDWKEVEKYARKYINEVCYIATDKEYINIASDFPDEFAHSNDTERLRGGNAKAKANSVQGIKEILEIASNKRYKENYTTKHKEDAQKGWYRYTSRISLPIYKENDIEKYNVNLVTVLVRHAANGKKYLYDLVNIKKEAEYPA